MNGKIDNLVLIGAPVMEIGTSAKVSIIWAAWDPLSWTIGWGFDAYFAGWFGHTDYFNSSNIGKVVSIIADIIV